MIKTEKIEKLQNKQKITINNVSIKKTRNLSSNFTQVKTIQNNHNKKPNQITENNSKDLKNQQIQKDNNIKKDNINKYLYNLSNGNSKIKDYLFAKYSSNIISAKEKIKPVLEDGIKENTFVLINQSSNSKNTVKQKKSKDKNSYNNLKTTLNTLNLNDLLNSTFKRSQTPNRFKIKTNILNTSGISSNSININSINQYNYNYDCENLYEENLKLKKTNNKLAKENTDLNIELSKYKKELQSKEDLILEMTSKHATAYLGTMKTDLSNKFNNKVMESCLNNKLRDKLNEIEKEKKILESTVSELKKGTKLAKLNELQLENKLFEENFIKQREIVVKKDIEYKFLKNELFELKSDYEKIKLQNININKLKEQEKEYLNEIELLKKKILGSFFKVQDKVNDENNVIPSFTKKSEKIIQSNLLFNIDICYLICDEIEENLKSISYKLKTFENNLQQSINVSIADKSLIKSLNDEVISITSLIKNQRSALKDKVLTNDFYYLVNDIDFNKNKSKQNIIQKIYKENREHKLNILLLESKKSEFLVSQIREIMKNISDGNFKVNNNQYEISNYPYQDFEIKEKKILTILNPSYKIAIDKEVNLYSVNLEEKKLMEEILEDSQEIIYIYIKNYEALELNKKFLLDILSSFTFDFNKKTNDEKKFEIELFAKKLISLITPNNRNYSEKILKFFSDSLLKLCQYHGDDKMINIFNKSSDNIVNYGSIDTNKLLSYLLQIFTNNYQQLLKNLTLLDDKSNYLITFQNIKEILNKLNLNLDETYVEYLLYFMKKNCIKNTNQSDFLESFDSLRYFEFLEMIQENIASQTKLREKSNRIQLTDKEDNKDAFYYCATIIDYISELIKINNVSLDELFSSIIQSEQIINDEYIQYIELNTLLEFLKSKILGKSLNETLINDFYYLFKYSKDDDALLVIGSLEKIIDFKKLKSYFNNQILSENKMTTNSSEIDIDYLLDEKIENEEKIKESEKDEFGKLNTPSNKSKFSIEYDNEIYD